MGPLRCANGAFHVATAKTDRGFNVYRTNVGERKMPQRHVTVTPSWAVNY